MQDTSLMSIHHTAIISPLADIADGVQIGPYCVIEDEVRIGPGCTIGPYVHIKGPVALGSENHIYTGCVLGEAPQHLKYNGEETRLEIGNNNIIREHVTLHRGTTHRGVTRIGSHNFLMAGSHVAHDCILGNHIQLANGAMIGGHCILDDGCIISGNATVHQNCRIGRLAMLGGLSGTTKNLPPFMLQQGINCITGINIIGLRRNGVPKESIIGIKKAFKLLFDDRNPMSTALINIENQLGDIVEVQELVEFIRSSKNGINRIRDSKRGLIMGSDQDLRDQE